MRSQPKKLLLVGDGYCGKTCLLCMFTRGVFPKDRVPTIFDKHSVGIKVNDQLVKLNVFDTGGAYDFNLERPLTWYPDTSVILMCFSVDIPASLVNIQMRWIPEVRHYCKDVPIILVGNKTDRRCETEMTVPFKEGQRMAQQINAAAYMECSAKNNEGIWKIFERAALIPLDMKIKPKTKCCIF